jgi:hypothetical protein
VIQAHEDKRVIVAQRVTQAALDKMVKMVLMVILVIMVAEDHGVQLDHLEPRVTREHVVAMEPMASLDPEVREIKLVSSREEGGGGEGCSSFSIVAMTQLNLIELRPFQGRLWQPLYDSYLITKNSYGGRDS